MFSYNRIRNHVRVKSSGVAPGRQMPQRLDTQNLPMPQPQDWHGRQMPLSGGGGRMGRIGFDLCIRDIERSNARVASKRSKVRGKKVTAHSHTRLPLEIKTLVVLRVRYSVSHCSLCQDFPRTNLSHLQTKHRPLWLHVFIFTHFNQSLTINNIATVTLAWHKIPHIQMIPRQPSVRLIYKLIDL